MVVHIISVGLTGFYFYLAKPASDLFSWYPVCMSMAFVLLMLQAIMIFSTESSLTPTSPRPDKIQVLTNETRTTLGFKSIYLCTKHGTKYLIRVIYKIIFFSNYSFIGFFMHLEWLQLYLVFFRSILTKN